MMFGLSYKTRKHRRRYADFIYVKNISIKRARFYPRHTYLVEARLGGREEIRYSLRLAKTLKATLVADPSHENFGILAYRAYLEGIEIVPRYSIVEIREPRELEKIYKKHDFFLFSSLRLFFIARSLRDV